MKQFHTAAEHKIQTSKKKFPGGSCYSCYLKSKIIFVREFYTLFPHLLESTCPPFSYTAQRLKFLGAWVDFTSDYMSRGKASYMDKPQVNEAGIDPLPRGDYKSQQM